MEHRAEGPLFPGMTQERHVGREFFLRAHGIDKAKPIAAGVIGQDPMADHVG